MANKFTANNSFIKQKLQEKILKLKDINYIILPKLTIVEKKMFLTSFITSIDDIHLKIQLENELNQFTDEDDFGFEIDIKEKNYNLYSKYEMMKGRYLVEMVKKKYTPLGITEQTDIIW